VFQNPVFWNGLPGYFFNFVLELNKGFLQKLKWGKLQGAERDEQYAV
jgi:hypothetical protein